MAVLKEIVLTVFHPQIITKTINIKAIPILFSRQDAHWLIGRFESNSIIA